MRAWIVVAMLGCSRGDERPQPTPPAQQAGKPPAPSWELVLSYSYGPCSEDDARSCHVTWTATPDGKIVKVSVPNDPKKQNETTTITLSPAERDELAAVVASSEFTDGMTKGFACQGGGADPDARLQISFGGQRQHIEYCVHQGPDNVPQHVERLVRR